MNETNLLEVLTRGEDSRHQFKLDASNTDSVAAELAAFANSGGGELFFGVGDDAAVRGLDAAAVRRLNQLLGNAASQHVRPPIHTLTENVPTTQGIVIVVKVPDGLSKPYMDQQGRIWIKQGADKRHVTAREEIQRMFQRSGLVYADLVPVAGTSAADIDEKSFNAYLNRRYGQSSEFAGQTHEQLLQNLGLGDGRELNLAGLMLFGRQPQRHRPAFEVKAVAFPGKALHDTRYLDSEDIGGTLPEQYQRSLAFIRRNLHHVQRDQSFNSLGQLEIAEQALIELLVNALIHRDYFTSASIRLMVFADRVEIISPGHLPDSLNTEGIRRGMTNRRNPTLTEHAVHILPYRGLGTGIPRALQDWPDIELIDEVSANQFRVVIQRPKSNSISDPVTDPVADQVSDPVNLVLLMLIQGPLASSTIQARMGLKHRPTFRANYLRPALEGGFIEMTIPEKPNSRLQRYRLTDTGRARLNNTTR